VKKVVQRPLYIYYTIRFGFVKGFGQKMKKFVKKVGGKTTD